MDSIPVVVKWDSYPLDLRDPFQRFKRSEWNYFLADQQAKVVVGYWEAEEGVEDVGSSQYDELMLVLEGRLYVTCEGRQYIAEQGDTVVIRSGRITQVAVRGTSRIFFICYPVPDAEGFHDMVVRMMAERGV